MSAFDLVTLQHTLYASKNPTRRWLHCSRRDWILDALRRYADTGKGRRALEIGPGSGVYLPALAGLFDEVLAVDVEDAYLRGLEPLLDAHRNVSTARDDITASLLPSESVSLILCSEVIEHIPDSVRAIAEMHRLLRPGGVLILSTPQRFSPLEVCAKVAFLPGVIRVVRAIYGEAVLETGHINLLTAQQAQDQITRAGFAIEARFKSGMYVPFVAEFFGESGLAIERWLERKLRDGPADWLLWTQYYVARKR
jgi:SAM-dependent methyltransferase